MSSDTQDEIKTRPERCCVHRSSQRFVPFFSAQAPPARALLALPEDLDPSYRAALRFGDAQLAAALRLLGAQLRLVHSDAADIFAECAQHLQCARGANAA